MRILLVTDSFSTGGGIEHIFQLVSGISEHEFVVTGKKGPAQARFAQLSNTSTLNRPVNSRLLKDYDFDIIHFHHIRPLIFYKIRRIFTGGNLKEPVKFFTAHGLHIHKYEFTRSGISPLKYRLRFFMEKYFYRQVDRVIAVSREDKSFLEKNYFLRNVNYLTNGIAFPDNKVSAAEKLQARKQFSLRESQRYFAVIARFNFQKGYDILLRALVKISRLLEAGNVEFLLVGDGPELKVMKEFARARKISHLIRFMGNCEQNQVMKIMGISEIVILPSRWEGLPIVLLEAGAMSKPVLVSDTYGNREIVDRECGILFRNQSETDLADRMADVVNRTLNLNKYAENLNRKVISEYSLSVMVNGLRELYRKSAGKQ